MEQLGVIAFKVLAIMAVLLVVWLAMGKRELGDFTPLILPCRLPPERWPRRRSPIPASD